MNPATRLDLRASEAAIAALFAEAFAQPFDAALWRWKYRPDANTPAGLAYGVFDEMGRLLAHYGGWRREVWYRRRLVPALEVVDVMARRTAAASLSLRERPIVAAAQALLTHELGAGRPQLLGFGFPNARAFRFFARLGFYQAVGRVWVLSATPLPDAPSGTWQALPWPALADPLWRRFLARWEHTLARHYAVPRRDVAWLRTRYAEHPSGRYRLYALWQRRWGQNRPVALIVGAAAVDDPAAWESLELLALPQHLPAAWQAARHLAHRHGAQRLVLWASEALARCLPDATRHDLGIVIPHNALVTEPSPHELYDRWWLVGGDSDFR